MGKKFVIEDTDIPAKATKSFFSVIM